MSKCNDCKYGNYVFIAPGEDYEFECLCERECTTKNGHECFEPRCRG